VPCTADQRLQPNPIIRKKSPQKTQTITSNRRDSDSQEAADPLPSEVNLSARLSRNDPSVPPPSTKSDAHLHRPPEPVPRHRSRASHRYGPASACSSLLHRQHPRRQCRPRPPTSSSSATLTVRSSAPSCSSSSRPRPPPASTRASSSASWRERRRPPALQPVPPHAGQDAEFFDANRVGDLLSRLQRRHGRRRQVRHAEPQRRRQQRRHRIAALGSWPGPARS